MTCDLCHVEKKQEVKNETHEMNSAHEARSGHKAQLMTNCTRIWKHWFAPRIVTNSFNKDGNHWGLSKWKSWSWGGFFQHFWWPTSACAGFTSSWRCQFDGILTTICFTHQSFLIVPKVPNTSSYQRCAPALCQSPAAASSALLLLRLRAQGCCTSAASGVSSHKDRFLYRIILK
jgi:hypothetical protein